jgi:hypothetical protein
MKHKRQHSNGIVSKEERTNRIRQLLGSPTTQIRIHPPEDPANTGDVIKAVDADGAPNGVAFVSKKSLQAKIQKSKRKFEKSVPAHSGNSRPEQDGFRLPPPEFFPAADADVADFDDGTIDAKNVSVDASIFLSNGVEATFEQPTQNFLPPSDLPTAADACRGFHDAYSDYSGYGNSSNDAYQNYPGVNAIKLFCP